MRFIITERTVDILKEVGKGFTKESCPLKVDIEGVMDKTGLRISTNKEYYIELLTQWWEQFI